MDQRRGLIRSSLAAMLNLLGPGCDKRTALTAERPA